MTYAMCKRMSKAILGPLTRLWKDGDRVIIGTDHGTTRYVYGIGASYYEAFKDAFVAAPPAPTEITSFSEGSESVPTK